MTNTPLRAYTHPCVVQQSRRQWVWAAFRSVTVFTIIPSRVLGEPEQRPIPALWLQGLPLFFARNTDIITSLKEPAHLAFSFSLRLTQVSCPHVSSDRFSHPGLNPLHSAAEVPHKRPVHMPMGLRVFKALYFVFFFIWPPWSHSSVKRCDFPVNWGHWVVFLLIMWALNATPAPKAAKYLSHTLAANSKHYCYNPSAS